MGLSRTVSDINGDFRGKSQIIPTPVYFAPPLKRLSLELGTGAWCKKLEWWATRSRKKVDDICRCPLDAMHERDRQADGRTDGQTRATTHTAHYT